ncbi:MAG: serine protease, partial [Alphaproteobacteria bacterium]
RVNGTGFVVSSHYVLTAAHVFEKLNELPLEQRKNVIIRGSLLDKPGDGGSSPFPLTIADQSEAEDHDIVLLRLPDNTAILSVAPICLNRPDRTVAPGEEIFAFGFPYNENFQPVRGTLGTQNAPGERWFASIAFAPGMSGGPVYSAKGYVMGLVNGGLENTDAVRYITPLKFATRLLRGFGFTEKCDAPGEPVIGSWRGTYSCHDGWGNGQTTLRVTRNSAGVLVGDEGFTRGFLAGGVRHEIEVLGDSHYRFSSQTKSFPSISYHLTVQYDRSSTSLTGRYVGHPNCDRIYWRRD